MTCLLVNVLTPTENDFKEEKKNYFYSKHTPANTRQIIYKCGRMDMRTIKMHAKHDYELYTDCDAINKIDWGLN